MIKNKKEICKEIKETYRRFNNGEIFSYDILSLFYYSKLMIDYCSDLQEWEKKKLKRILSEVERHFSRQRTLYSDYKELCNDFQKLLPFDDNLGIILQNKRNEIHRRSE